MSYQVQTSAQIKTTRYLDTIQRDLCSDCVNNSGCDIQIDVRTAVKERMNYRITGLGYTDRGISCLERQAR
ncbi:MAG: hypothetical protein KJ600_01450 [Nanoarchaeota archaeon]|nr:hypothetical protein [Nanoarchaeota archaeon]MBU1103205.1 hypothetical protein [Nanoarchaeota archaeon]